MNPDDLTPWEQFEQEKDEAELRRLAEQAAKRGHATNMDRKHRDKIKGILRTAAPKIEKLTEEIDKILIDNLLDDERLKTDPLFGTVLVRCLLKTAAGIAILSSGLKVTEPVMRKCVEDALDSMGHAIRVQCLDDAFGDDVDGDSVEDEDDDE